VRYWVPSVAEAQDERAVLALAGFTATMETFDPEDGS
jgi:hypothetical protein